MRKILSVIACAAFALFLILPAACEAARGGASGQTSVKVDCNAVFERGLDAYDRAALQEAFDAMEQARACWLKQSGGAETTDSTKALNYSGLVLAQAGQFREALDRYDALLEIVTVLLGAESGDVAVIINNAGEALRQLGDYRSALEHFERALEIDLKVYGEQSAAAARDYNNMGAVYKEQGDIKKALELYEKTLEIDRAILGDDHPEVALDMSNIGVALMDLGDARGALERFENALEMHLATLGENHPSVALDYSNIGAARSRLAEYGAAQEAFTKSMAIRKAVYGENHPDVAMTYENMGAAQQASGDLDAAMGSFRSALAIRRRALGDDHPHTANNTALIGDVFLEQGLYEEALAEYESALAVFRKISGEDSPNVIGMMGRIGSAHLRMSGDYEVALEYYGKALVLAEKLAGPDSPGAASWRNAIGNVRLEQGRADQAIEQFSAALEIYEKTYGPDHPDTAMAADNLGIACHKAGQFDKALEHHLRALDIYTKVYGENNSSTANTLNSIGYLLDSLGDYAKAADYYRRAIASFRAARGGDNADTATFLSNLGIVYMKAGDYQGSLQTLNQALAIKTEIFGKDSPELAAVYNNLGFTYFNMGEIPRALENYQAALDRLRTVYGDKHPDAATAISNIGVAYYQTGEFELALEYYQRALDAQLALLGAAHPDVARTYNNIAEAMRRRGDFEAAMDNFKKALDTDIAAFGKEHPAVARDAGNIAMLYMDLGMVKDSVELSKLSLDIRLKLFGEDHPDIALSYNNIGYALYLDGKPGEALEYFTKTLELRRRTQGEHHPEVASVLINMAIAYKDMNDLKSASEHVRRALEVQCGGDANAPLEQCRPEETTVTALGLAGSYALGAGQAQQAAEFFERAADAIDALRASLGSEEAKTRFGSNFYEIFPDGIAAFALLARETGEGKYLEKAFEFAEKGIGRVFLEMLGSRRALVDGGLPADVVARGAALQARLAQARDAVDAIERLPAEQQKQDARRLAYSDYQTAGRDLDEHEQGLLKDYPAYAELMRPRPRPLQEIRDAVLQPGETALEFYLGRDVSWVFAITQDSLYVHQLPPAGEIERRIDLFRQKLMDPNAESAAVQKLGAALYKLLIEPAQEQVAGAQKILIVPTGKLYFLPFESLAAERDGALRWLADLYDIRYAPSMNVLHMSGGRAPGAQDGRGWLGFGDPVYGADDPRGEGRAMTQATERAVAAYTRGLAGEDTAATRVSLWMRIPGTGIEVKTIAELLGARDVYLGAEATEARFKAEAPRGAKFVHGASHGTLGEGGAGQPALVLSLVGNDAEDGFLTMTEVFNMKTPADTVVLSACKTGQGVMERGEGVAGLSRAFLYAGAGSLVVSLWSVADEETKNFMVDFYQRVKGGQAPGAALNAARRAMIAAGLHPYYWAPFVFVGGRAE